MKRVSILLLAIAPLASDPASAGNCSGRTSFGMSFDDPVRIAQRHDLRDVDLAITSDNRKVVLVLTDRVVAMQLSDRVLRKVDRKMKNERADGEDHVIGRAIKTAVLASVRSALSHSAEIRIRDIDSAVYRDGELILKARNGERIFADTDVDNDNVMRNFSESEAKMFVRELRRRMDRDS